MSRTRKIKLPQFDEKEIVTFVNPGEWFSRRWLIGVGAGFDCLFYIVEGDHEQDVIDNLTDSDEFGRIIRTDEMCEYCEEVERMEHPDSNEDCSADNPKIQELWNNCYCNFAGNAGERVNLDDIRILERLT